MGNIYEKGRFCKEFINLDTFIYHFITYIECHKYTSAYK